MYDSHIPFRARLVVFDTCIQELDVFVWELEPVGEDIGRVRPAREWIEDHIREWGGREFEENFGEIATKVAFEAVFTADILAYTLFDNEYEEEVHVHPHFLIQELPEEWFEVKDTPPGPNGHAPMCPCRTCYDLRMSDKGTP